MVKLKLVHTAEEVVDDGYIDPAKLHKHLRRAAIAEITFRSEKQLEAYRRMLYSINKQGHYRYRTLRSEAPMFAIMIWRMH